MGLVLAGQPISILANLSAELEELTRSIEMESKQAGAIEQVGIAVENSEALTDTAQIEEMEVGGVRETLSEVLTDAEPSFAVSVAVKIGPYALLQFFLFFTALMNTFIV